MSITRATCADCDDSYFVVSTETETLQGLCTGCYAERQQDEEAKKPEQSDTSGEPPTDPSVEPFIHHAWPL